MKLVVELCAVGLVLTCVTGAESLQKPALRKGVSVEMPVAGHAVEMRAADEAGATVVAVTRDGRVFLGAEAAGLSTLSSLSEETVYVKADAQAPYQKVLSVLDALHGRQVVLITASPRKAEKGQIVPPYGLKLRVGP